MATQRRVCILALLARATAFYSLSITRSQLSSHNIATVDGIVSSEQHDEEHYYRELFSVAPMMGHTNRHYRYFFRLFSKRSHLYTEMVPSAQIVRAYHRARAIYLGVDRNHDQLNTQEILEVIARISETPGKEYQCRNQRDITTLSELIGISGTVEHPVALQLGGSNPETLGMASLIGKAYGKYDSINLNCGCPSNAVQGWSGGAVLMKDPDHVARCLEAMNDSISTLAGVKESIVTVKHRLGVKDASTYHAAADRQKDDTESYETCRKFVKTIALSGAAVKCHVHARVALLGEFLPDESETQTSSQRRQQLWVPGQKEFVTNERLKEKIDHKREQERARRRARQATIKNRDVPPLRPGVVHRLVDEFPHLEFVTNGGVQTLSDVKKIIDNGLGTNVVGAMVGRAAINHPCAFASADTLWEIHSAQGKTTLCRPTRGEVLRDYITYCDREEERMISLGGSPESIEILRRRLVAVPFHLFVGEKGSDAFQRRVKKLTSRSMLIRASSILSGASSFLPAETLDKCVDDHVPWENIVGAFFSFLNECVLAITYFFNSPFTFIFSFNCHSVYEDALHRSSAMQRIVY